MIFLSLFSASGIDTLNQLLFTSEKIYQGSQESHCHENLSPQTSLFHMSLIQYQILKYGGREPVYC